MIKFVHKTQPQWWQVNNDHDLPSTTGPVQWNGDSKQLEVRVNGMWRPIGNTIEIVHDETIGECLAWIKHRMREEKKLEEMRSKYPALDEAYKHAEFIKQLLKDQDDIQ